jgi:hypothetical protein
MRPFGDEFVARFVADTEVERLNSALRVRWARTAPFMFYIDRVDFTDDDHANVEARLVLRSRDPIRGHAVRTPIGWRLGLDVMKEFARMGDVS